MFTMVILLQIWSNRWGRRLGNIHIRIRRLLPGLFRSSQLFSLNRLLKHVSIKAMRTRVYQLNSHVSLFPGLLLDSTTWCQLNIIALVFVNVNLRIIPSQWTCINKTSAKTTDKLAIKWLQIKCNALFLICTKANDIVYAAIVVSTTVQKRGFSNTYSTDAIDLYIG